MSDIEEVNDELETQRVNVLDILAANDLLGGELEHLVRLASKPTELRMLVAARTNPETEFGLLMRDAAGIETAVETEEDTGGVTDAGTDTNVPPATGGTSRKSAKKK
jgi:hypothetical protein